MQQVPAKPSSIPEAKDITNTYTCIWFYVPGTNYVIRKFKYAGASFFKALTKLREIEPESKDICQSTIVEDTLYYTGTYSIEEL